MIEGKYKAYPEYKDSEDELIGKIPLNWIIKKLKWEILVKSGIDEKVENGKYILYGANGQIGYSNTKSIKNNSGVVLIGRVGSAGSVTYVTESSGVSDNALIVNNNFLDLPKYDYYLLQSLDLNKWVAKNAQPLITATNIKDIKIAISNVKHERVKIANFLDHETAKIDTLIEKQRELIKLLKEKRQAVISHAVTKGLNPDARMRDSGVEWLGEVPEHWEIKRFKNLFKIRKRIAGTLGQDVLSITQKGIKIKDIDSGEGQLSMDYSKYQIVNKGDFAMNHMDLLTGFVDISSFNGVTSPDYRVFTLEDKNSIPEYYLYFMQMGYINKLFFPFGQGAAHIGRWRLPTEAFNEFCAPCPPASEQETISIFIKKNIERMTHLEEKAKSAINLMQERRTALISAAVTGKIDVRDWKPSS